MSIRAKMRAWDRPKGTPARTIAGVYVDSLKAAEYKGAFMVCGMSVCWDIIEQGAAVFAGKEKPAGLTADPDFCQECSEIYNRESEKLTNYNAHRGLNKAGEPLPDNLSKGDNKIMKHNDFKGYLGDVKQIRDKAILSYNQIVEEWNNAKQTWEKAQHSGLSDRDMLIEKAAYMQAEDAYKQAMQDLTDSTNAQIADVRKEMKQHTDSFYMADPSRLDANTMTLLNSGILSSKELAHLAEQNRGNTTMLRMIGKVAKDRRNALAGKRGAADDELIMLSHKLDTMGAGEKELEALDGVAVWVRRCINPDATIANVNNRHFDRIYNEYLQSLDSITAQPEAPAEE